MPSKKKGRKPQIASSRKSRSKTSINAKSKRKYFPEIDLLKAGAALLVILIHVLSRYKLSSDNIFLFWDLIHFSVGIFVLVSGFLFQNSNPEINTLRDLWDFLVKKFLRIVVPYYIFALTFLFFMSISGKVDLMDYMTVEKVVDTLFLWGGVGNNWIPLLFMSIMVVVGFERLLIKKVKYLPYIIFFVSLAASIFLMTRDLDFLSKFNNLPGWLVVFYIGRYIYTKYEVKTFIYLLLFGAVLSLFLNYFFEMMGLNTGIYANKYPPNLYFIAYNIAASVIIWGIMYKLRDVAQKNSRIWSTVKFISINSYEIFFYHLLIMEFWKYRVNWFVDWILISAITIVFLFVSKLAIRKIKEFVGSKRKKKGKN